MKKFIYTLLITLAFSCMASASGKFMFKPERNMTKGTSSVEMGLSIYENILAKKLFLNHYTGLVTVADKETSFYDMNDFVFKNGLVVQPMDLLQIEVGHEWHKNLKSSYQENIGYFKVSTQLW